MLEFICLFFPAVLSVFIMEQLCKKHFSFRNTIYLFVTNTLFINVIIFAIKFFLLDTSNVPLSSESGMTVNSAFKYLIMAIPLSFITAAAMTFFYHRFRIRCIDTNSQQKLSDATQNK